MKFFVGLLLVAVCAAGVASAAVSELEPMQPNDQQGAEAADNLDSLRVRKAARSYGGAAPAAAPAYLPSIPCPKNYLFSCQPQVAPVPCAPSGGYGGHGGHGAYSEPIAQWTPYNPQEN